MLLQHPPVMSDGRWRQATVVSIVVAALVVFTSDVIAAAEKEAGSTVQLRHQNEFVTLKLASLNPDDTVELGGLTRTVLYLLGNGQALIRSSGGSEDIAAYAQDSVLPLRDEFLEMHNTGENTLEYLFIRSEVSPLKADPPGPSEYRIRTLYTPPVPGEHGVRQVFDDDTFRIIETVLPPSGKIPVTVHLSGVYFALNDHQGELVFADERTETYLREPGDAWWLDSEEYTIRNPGSSPMHFVFIGIKPVARYGEYEP